MHMHSAMTLQTAMNQNKLTSEAIVLKALAQIAKHDETLNALSDVNHQAVYEARALDLERQQKGPRSLLHGIPILIKDNIFTHDHMRTTINSVAFEHFYAPFDATLIKALKKAGAIILAKANCTEFAYFMSMNKMPSGYGGLNGQVIHPFDPTMDPSGSSTGSAVGVAALYAPLAVGTETFGSLLSPAKANRIVTIKPSLGMVSRCGIVPISSLQDTAGPMSHTVKDAALLLQTMRQVDEDDITTKMNPYLSEDLLKACDNDIKGKQVGLLQFKGHPKSEAEQRLLNEAKQHLQTLGAEVKDVEVPYELTHDLNTMVPEFNRDLNAFLASIKHVSPVDSLPALTKFNQTHHKRALKYGQQHFYQSTAADHRLKDKAYIQARTDIYQAVETFKRHFKTYDVDVFITTQINGYPAFGGLPAISVPAGTFKQADSHNILFIGNAFEEHVILPFAHQYERARGDLTHPPLISQSKS